MMPDRNRHVAQGAQWIPVHSNAESPTNSDYSFLPPQNQNFTPINQVQAYIPHGGGAMGGGNDYQEWGHDSTQIQPYPPYNNSMYSGICDLTGGLNSSGLPDLPPLTSSPSTTYPVPNGNTSYDTCIGLNLPANPPYHNCISAVQNACHQQVYSELTNIPSGSQGGAESHILNQYRSYHPPAIQRCQDPSVTRDQSNLALINENRNYTPRRCRGRSVAQGMVPLPGSIPGLTRVFIWDLDETIIVFHSLLTGAYAAKYKKDLVTVKQLGLKMEALIYELLDNYFFFKDFELFQECDQVHINDALLEDSGEDLSEYDFASDGFTLPASSSTAIKGELWFQKLAFRYRKVKEIYSEYRCSVEGLLGPDKKQQWQSLLEAINVITEYWSKFAKNCFDKIVTRNNCVNVLVTTSQLAPALVKLLLFDIGNLFPIENVYSAASIGKKKCFERVVYRFSPWSCTYVVVGDGQEEADAANEMNMPFWRIAEHDDLINMRHALEMEYL